MRLEAGPLESDYCIKMGVRQEGLNQDSSYRNGEVGTNTGEKEKVKSMGLAEQLHTKHEWKTERKANPLSLYFQFFYFFL